jgi:hypothetical protein
MGVSSGVQKLSAKMPGGQAIRKKLVNFAFWYLDGFFLGL